MFNRSEVIVLTNKQTPLKTSTSTLRCATPVGKYFTRFIYSGMIPLLQNLLLSFFDGKKR